MLIISPEGEDFDFKYRTLNAQYRIMKGKFRYWTFKIHYSILLLMFLLTLIALGRIWPDLTLQT
jgi:hypothetical protein